eukprot:scaffold2550_cov272-Prasinococcus_capsulatus_cf.AAC.1
MNGWLIGCSLAGWLVVGRAVQGPAWARLGPLSPVRVQAELVTAASCEDDDGDGGEGAAAVAPPDAAVAWLAQLQRSTRRVLLQDHAGPLAFLMPRRVMGGVQVRRACPCGRCGGTATYPRWALAVWGRGGARRDARPAANPLLRMMMRAQAAQERAQAALPAMEWEGATVALAVARGGA